MRTVVLSVLAFALLAVPAAPASAADEIGLSRDGQTWSSTLTDPLFDSGVTWVPGDVRRVSFWVRNRASTSAVISATVLAAGDRLISDEHVVLRARTNGAWIPLKNGKTSRQLTDATISAGGKVKVTLEAAFDPASTNVSQTQSTHLTLGVRLTEAASAVSSDAGGDPGRWSPAAPVEDADQDFGGDGIADWLPQTGANLPLTIIWLAVLATAAGGGFLAAARSRPEKKELA